MEKYCQDCGRVFKDSNFKLCPYCGNQLSTRAGRQSIPRKLRHQVFQRDGYRCRECGATNKQTRLHVDHIVPVARGGTNDLSNLQTLCEECNKAKYTDEWIGGEVKHETMFFKNKKDETEIIRELHEKYRTTEYLRNKEKIDKEKHDQFMVEKYGTKICPNCGKEILSNAIRCKYCKSTFKECPICGKIIFGELSRCNYCNSIFIKCSVCGKEILDNGLMCESCKSSFKKCPKCDKLILRDATRCKYCNHYFMKKCPKCGIINNINAKKCGNCTYRFDD